MSRLILSYGLLAGLIVGVPLFGLTVGLNGHPDLPYGVAIGYLTMLIALSTVFVAIKRRRDTDLGGVIGFWQGLGMGLAITVIAGICYVLAWEAALAYAHVDFAASYAHSVIEHARERGASADALAKLTAQMERFKVQYANPVYRTLMTFTEIFPVGVLVSLISAGLLRNPRFLPARRAGAGPTPAA